MRPLTARARTTWSRRLTYLLRHNPGHAGLTLTDDGWVDIATLTAAVPDLTADIVHAVVADDDKGRFALDGTRIRCVHGHSAGVADHAHTAPATPPATLYHGTTARAAAAIARDGITAQTRRHVHLSTYPAAAADVAARRGTPVILTVDTAAAHDLGVRFHHSGNGIWLTDHVPAAAVHHPTTPH